MLNGFGKLGPPSMNFTSHLPVSSIGSPLGWWYCQRAPSVPLTAGRRATEQETRSRWWFSPYVSTLRPVALATGVAFVAIQLVPYGRSHTNLLAAAPSGGPALAAYTELLRLYGHDLSPRK